MSSLRALAAQILWSAAAVLGAHALAFALMHALPSAATIALGLQSADREVVAAFEQTRPSRTYFVGLTDLFRGELGITLDGTPVAEELARALQLSAPCLLLALLLVCAVALSSALARPWLQRFRQAFDFSVFLPPYLFSFLALAAALVLAGSGVDVPSYLLVAISAALPAAALLGAQVLGSMAWHEHQPYATTLRFSGLDGWRLRASLMRGVIADASPAFEKAVSLVLAALIFAEPILGRAGIGTLVTRAARRSDVDMILGAVLLLSLIVVAARVLGWTVRWHFRVAVP